MFPLQSPQLSAKHRSAQMALRLFSTILLTSALFLGIALALANRPASAQASTASHATAPSSEIKQQQLPEALPASQSLYRAAQTTDFEDTFAVGTDNHPTRDIAWGDVDGDGDLDVLAGNLGAKNRILLNILLILLN